MTARSGVLSNFVLKVTDLALVLSALGLTIVFRYSPSNNVEFAVDYLSERIKVSNALLGIGLLITWHLAFESRVVSLASVNDATARAERDRARCSFCTLALLVRGKRQMAAVNLVTVRSSAFSLFP